jgi:alkylation response protein AidB-like acyl-CoA dehydrogenase
MDFDPSETQNDLRDLARGILEAEVTNEKLKDLEREGDGVIFDRALWAALGKANLLGIAIPESHGGSDFGFLELTTLLQEIGRTVAPVPAYASLALGALPLVKFGTAAQQDAWLAGVASGETILTAALTEYDTVDRLSPTTEAKPDGDGFRLDGVKASVPAGPIADRILVPATLADGRVGLFWLDPAAEGVQLEEQALADRQPAAQLTLRGAQVSANDVLGDLDQGRDILRWLVDRATVALCAIELGVCERALEMTAAYGNERRQFDRPIGSFQAVHTRAADAFIQAECIRLSTWEAAWKLSVEEEGSETERAVAIAKYWASEGGQFIAYACQHLHGGIGIDIDYPLHRYYLWATQIEHSLGAASQQIAALGAQIAADGISRV